MRKLAIVPSLAAALLAAACGSKASSKPAGNNLTVSARGAPGGTLIPGGALQVSPALSVDRVRLVVKEIELEPAEAPPRTGMTGDDLRGRAAEHGDGDDDHPEGEVRVGPFLVDLSGGALAGPVTAAFDADIPAGAYRELRLDVEPISPADAGASTGLRDMAVLEASVAIDGTAGTGSAAAPFHLALPLHARVKKEAAFTVGAKTTNVTVAVDVAAWLAGVTDPSSAAGRERIAANILGALGLFVDDDEDGEDDHGD